MRFLPALVVLLSFQAFGDRIVLKNGKEYRGTFVDADGVQVRFRTGRHAVQTFPSGDVSRLEIGNRRSATNVNSQRTAPSAPPAAAPSPGTQSPPRPLTVPQLGTSNHAGLQGANAIGSEYTHMGEEDGPLGEPRAAYQSTADGRATVRFYAHGAIYWTPGGGAHALTGPVFDAWLSQGGERSRLGYPITDEQDAEAGFSREQRFQGGRIMWTQKDGAAVVYSAQ